MKTMLSVSLAATCLFLFTGCKKAAPPPPPKFQVAVPAGWEATDLEAQAGEQAKVLTSAGLERVKIMVACLSAEKNQMETMVAENLAIVAQIGGQVTQFDVAEDGSSVRLAFTAESEQFGTLIGKLLFKKDSSGQGKILTVVSIWPASQDAAASVAFESIAASADFK